jgi:hypothetical protein
MAQSRATGILTHTSTLSVSHTAAVRESNSGQTAKVSAGAKLVRFNHSAFHNTRPVNPAGERNPLPFDK